MICRTCQGIGETHYLVGEEGAELRDCSHCQGTGRAQAAPSVTRIDFAAVMDAAVHAMDRPFGRREV